MTRQQMKTLTSIYPFIEEYASMKEAEFGGQYDIHEAGNGKSSGFMHKNYDNSNNIAIMISDNSTYPYAITDCADPSIIKITIDSDGSYHIYATISFVKKIDERDPSVWKSTTDIWLDASEADLIEDLLKKINESPFKDYEILDVYCVNNNDDLKIWNPGGEDEFTEEDLDKTQKFKLPDEILKEEKE